MQIKTATLFFCIALLILGCGRKTGLIVYDDSAPLPEIISLSHEISNKKLSLLLAIQGGSGEVSYQIDRAVIEPDCKCIGNWLRYYESSASQQRNQLTRNIKIRDDRSYAFRVRVEDSLNRRSAWSEVIKVINQNNLPIKNAEAINE